MELLKIILLVSVIASALLSSNAAPVQNGHSEQNSVDDLNGDNPTPVERFYKDYQNGTIEFKTALANGNVQYQKITNEEINGKMVQKTEGYMSEKLPDGSLATRHYVADENGFRSTRVSLSRNRARKARLNTVKPSESQEPNSTSKPKNNYDQGHWHHPKDGLAKVDPDNYNKAHKKAYERNRNFSGDEKHTTQNKSPRTSITQLPSSEQTSEELSTTPVSKTTQFVRHQRPTTTAQPSTTVRYKSTHRRKQTITTLTPTSTEKPLTTQVPSTTQKTKSTGDNEHQGSELPTTSSTHHDKSTESTSTTPTIEVIVNTPVVTAIHGGRKPTTQGPFTTLSSAPTYTVSEDSTTTTQTVPSDEKSATEETLTTQASTTLHSERQPRTKGTSTILPESSTEAIFTTPVVTRTHAEHNSATDKVSITVTSDDESTSGSEHSDDSVTSTTPAIHSSPTSGPTHPEEPSSATEDNTTPAIKNTIDTVSNHSLHYLGADEPSRTSTAPATSTSPVPEISTTPESEENTSSSSQENHSSSETGSEHTTESSTIPISEEKHLEENATTEKVSTPPNESTTSTNGSTHSAQDLRGEHATAKQEGSSATAPSSEENTSPTTQKDHSSTESGSGQTNESLITPTPVVSHSKKTDTISLPSEGTNAASEGTHNVEHLDAEHTSTTAIPDSPGSEISRPEQSSTLKEISPGLEESESPNEGKNSPNLSEHPSEKSTTTEIPTSTKIESMHFNPTLISEGTIPEAIESGNQTTKQIQTPDNPEPNHSNQVSTTPLSQSELSSTTEHVTPESNVVEAHKNEPSNENPITSTFSESSSTTEHVTKGSDNSESLTTETEHPSEKSTTTEASTSSPSAEPQPDHISTTESTTAQSGKTENPGTEKGHIPNEHLSQTSATSRVPTTKQPHPEPSSAPEHDTEKSNVAEEPHTPHNDETDNPSEKSTVTPSPTSEQSSTAENATPESEESVSPTSEQLHASETEKSHSADSTTTEELQSDPTSTTEETTPGVAVPTIGEHHTTNKSSDIVYTTQPDEKSTVVTANENIHSTTVAPILLRFSYV